MCGGSLPSRADSKDLIAIIHPAGESQSRSSRSRSCFSGRLMLSNRHANFTTSNFSHTEDGKDSINMQETFHVRIHKYGQPICEASDFISKQSTHNPVLHSFVAGVFVSSILGLRLDLGVGGEGVVGRTISITDHDHKLLGQGVIGRI